MLIPPSVRPAASPRATLAFTVVELLVAVSLLSMIVYALYAMFNQTQRALRANVTQVDILEAGRAAADMVARDVEQATFGDVYNVNLYGGNYYSDAPVYQPLPSYGDESVTPPVRTNFLQSLFFVTRGTTSSNTPTWYANGFFVASPTNPAVRIGAAGVGTLYRYSAPPDPPTNRLTTNAYALFDQFLRAQTNYNYALTNSYPLIPGVLHMKWQAYDLAGRPMTYTRLTNYAPEVFLVEEVRPRGETAFQFFSNPTNNFTNALPAYLDLELGLLEPRVLEQMKSFPDPQRARSYLTNQVAKVHVFRQRIPIRTVPR